MKRVALLVTAVILVHGCGQKATTSAVSAKAKCADLGRNWAEARQSLLRLQHSFILMRPEFAYNQKLDTCLCMLGSWPTNGGFGGRRYE
jgi:hypothetical protein